MESVDARRRARRPFHLMIKPIGPLCNLACAYCFYLDKSRHYPGTSSFRMSDETLAVMTRRYIEAQPQGTREVNFAWQGGEPTLMGLGFFRRALALQQRFARPGMVISNALQTNGTRLDAQWARFLRDNRFLVGISIDGPEDMHDAFRYGKTGAGSFARVMRGLAVLKEEGVEFNTLTVISSRNGADPGRVYEFLKDIGSTYLQFIPAVFASDERQSETRDWNVPADMLGDFLIKLFDLWSRADVGRVYVQQFETMLGITLGLPATVCVNAVNCGRNLAVEHNGDVYSCDHYVDPDHLLGNLHDESLGGMLDGSGQLRFGLEKSRGLPAKCRRCEFLALCRGGCPKDRCARTVDGKGGLNRLCGGYRRFFEHTSVHFAAMATCLRHGTPAIRYREFLGGAGRVRPGRNDPCTCGSGKKYKHCCGRRH